MNQTAEPFEFLERLRGELVAASRRCAAVSPTGTSARRPLPRIARPSPRIAATLGVTFVLSGTALAATTQVFDPSGIQILRSTAALRNAGASDPLVRAFGLNPAAARPAFTAADGSPVSVVGDPQVSCMLIGDHPGDDHCSLSSAIAEGDGFFIGNDCSAGGPQTMRIGGFAPASTATVDIVYTSGPGLTSRVADGAYLIQSTNPAPGGPYPTRIDYLDPAGATLASSPIQSGDDLCMTNEITTEPPPS
jgi:hypothetical protein